MQIQIPDGLGAWLLEAAAKAGKTSDQFASEALERALEDREDYLLALEGLRSVAEEGTIPLEKVIRELDLENRTEQSSATAVRKAG